MSALHNADVIIQFLDLKLISENCLNFENSYLLNRNSDQNNFYMKSDQFDETNPDTLTTPLFDTSNYPNMELSPSGHLSDTGPDPGIISRLNSPFFDTV
jgi:hypothetical protein